jgi:hypothetical protein
VEVEAVEMVGAVALEFACMLVAEARDIANLKAKSAASQPAPFNSSYSIGISAPQTTATAAIPNTGDTGAVQQPDAGGRPALAVEDIILAATSLGYFDVADTLRRHQHMQSFLPPHALSAGYFDDRIGVDSDTTGAAYLDYRASLSQEDASALSSKVGKRSGRRNHTDPSELQALPIGAKAKARGGRGRGRGRGVGQEGGDGVVPGAQTSGTEQGEGEQAMLSPGAREGTPSGAGGDDDDTGSGVEGQGVVDIGGADMDDEPMEA